jgi:alginate O-acetyltransferase complex protein AlgI
MQPERPTVYWAQPRFAMVLSSPTYFAFLACVFFAFWLARRYRLGAPAVILFANYFFYARWNLIYLALIPLASSCDFFLGRALGRVRQPLVRRGLIALSIVLNVGLIVTVKYSPRLPWILPLGLSFYAFQALTYTLDIYRRDAEPASSFLTYLASASFFPTTIAGPITRLSNLIPQWSKWQVLSAEEGGRALFLIGLGLVKKLLIADYLAENLINRVFDLPKLYSGTEVLAGVYGYAFQLYYDFSGYTDIALGSALLLGIALPANFNRPYVAENIADFWRRWHISFSNWLRDYLYFSLPGLRSRWKIFAYLNLVVTMAIGGLWHGASWTFLIWGIWHGCGLAAQRWFRALRGNAAPSEHPAARTARALVTFHFVLISWVFFRAASVGTARDIFGQIFSGTVAFGNLTPGFLTVLAIAICAHFVPRAWYDAGLRFFSSAPYYAQAGAMALLVIAIQRVAGAGSAPFIYSRF